MPSHIKTYDGSEDPEDHLKIFQAAAKIELWAMPTWCHMFNSTLTGNARVWFDDLPQESIDSYDDLKKAFLENYLQQKKCIKDPVEIHNIKQRDGESTEEFVRRYKLEFNGRNDEGNHCIPQRRGGSFQSGAEEVISAMETAGSRTEAKLQERRLPEPTKFCEFHGEVGHTTDECMDLKRQIEEMLKIGKLSHLIKELKQNNRKDQAKAPKKGEAPGKDKPLEILMVQPWQKVAKQRITQTFFSETVISFPPLGEEDGTEDNQERLQVTSNVNTNVPDAQTSLGVQQPMAPVTLSTSESVSHSGSRLPHAQPSTHGVVEPASGRISHLFIDIQVICTS
ncbi:reverse transcriptase domain-containing protein, partial [Tanacetum coccineum]